MLKKYKQLEKKHPEVIMWSKTILGTVLCCAVLYASAASFGLLPNSGNNQPSRFYTGQSGDWRQGVPDLSSNAGQQGRAYAGNSSGGGYTEADKAQAIEQMRQSAAYAKRDLENKQPEALKKANAEGLSLRDSLYSEMNADLERKKAETMESMLSGVPAEQRDQYRQQMIEMERKAKGIVDQQYGKQ